jgi:hypothetical protein
MLAAMPWICERCQLAVKRDDVQACPGCGQGKSAWTVGGATRQLVVTTGTRLACLRGEDPSPTVLGALLYPPHALVPTAEARVVTKRVALDLAAAGQQPASLDLLVVRLFPKDALGAVTLGIEYAQRTLDEQEHKVVDAPFVDVRFLFVAGPEELPPEFTFPGLRVVDVTESDAANGFAPGVQVSAFKRPPIELPTVAADPTTKTTRFAVRLVDEATGAPLAGVPVRLLLGDGRQVVLPSDERGEVWVNDLPADAPPVTLEAIDDEQAWEVRQVLSHFLE